MRRNAAPASNASRTTSSRSCSAGRARSLSLLRSGALVESQRIRKAARFKSSHSRAHLTAHVASTRAQKRSETSTWIGTHYTSIIRVGGPYKSERLEGEIAKQSNTTPSRIGQRASIGKPSYENANFEIETSMVILWPPFAYK